MLCSGPFPDVKIGLFNGEATCEKTYRGVYSELDFVLIVATFDGENLELHRNGVSQGKHPCHYKVGPAQSQDPLLLGRNHFGGVIKSLAIWDRVLKEEEIVELDNRKLTC